MAKEPKKTVAKSTADKPVKPIAAPAKAAAEKPAAAPKKAAAAAKTPAKAAGGRSRKKAPAGEITPEQRYRMIQDAAYFIAERNGFAGDNYAYWLEAERAIDEQLGSR